MFEIAGMLLYESCWLLSDKEAEKEEMKEEGHQVEDESQDEDDESEDTEGQ